MACRERTCRVNIYIACNLTRRDLACEIANALRLARHDIVSTWHDSPSANITAERQLTERERRDIRERCFEEIYAADLLVLVACPGERHGAHVEAGCALGIDIPIVVFRAGGEVSILCGGAPDCTDVAGLLDVVATASKVAVSQSKTFAEYQAEMLRTCIHPRGKRGPTELTRDALGVAGEAGEVADLVKKVVFHGHPLDVAKLTNEMGDVLWYLASLCNTLGIDLADVADANTAKLRKRYPEGWDPARSLARSEGT